MQIRLWDKYISRSLLTRAAASGEWLERGDNRMDRKMESKYSEIFLNARRFKSIEVDEKILNGMPVIKNTRIPVSLIVACLKDEMTFGEICEEYKLTREEIETAMEYVIEILDAPYQEC